MDCSVVAYVLQRWKDSQELVGFRDAAALAKLPADEQKECQALWARAAELESRAEDIQQRLRAESALVPMPETRTAGATSKYNATPSPAQDTLTVGDEAPAISVSAWVKGDPVDRLDPSKMYVVAFWATWCGPCRVSIPHLTELQKKYTDKGLAIIGVSVDQSRDAVAPFVEQMGDKMDYHIATDDGPEGEPGRMAVRWMQAADQHEIPTAFIVKEGKIAWIGHPMGMDEALDKCSADNFDIQVAARPYRARDAFNHKQFAAASRLWAEVLTSDPTLDEHRQRQHRYNAARSAVLAVAGQGLDDPPVDDAAKATLRQQALEWLKAELSVNASRAGKAMIVAAAAPLPSLLDELAESAPDDPQFQAALTQHFAGRGKTSLATAARAKARVLFEQRLATEPKNATLAAELAVLLLDRQQQESGTGWRVLKPAEMKSEGGATLTLQPDDSVLASGVNPDSDLYEIKLEFQGRIAAVRLEAIPDPSMAAGGSGRAPTWGNFVLSDFRVMVGEKLCAWSQADADFSQEVRFGQINKFPISYAIDADESTGWAIWPRVAEPHWAVFLPSQPIIADRKSPLTIRMAFRRKGMLKYGLGRFRLSVSEDPAAFEREQKRFALLKVSDPWLKLAAAYAADGRNGKAAEYFGKALRADPKLGDDPLTQPRYNAARAAILASAGQSQDEPPLEDTAKAKLRQEALDWLKAELSTWKVHVTITAPGNLELATKTLANWKQQTDLGGVRDNEKLAKLPEAERKEWQAFWAEIDALLKPAGGRKL